jgi:hypothetical protein
LRGTSNAGKRTGLTARITVLIVLLSTLFLAGCGNPPSFSQQVDRIVSPYRFSIAGWELENLRKPVEASEKQALATPDDVLRYFSLTDQIGSLETQIQAVKSGTLNGDLTALTTQLNDAQTEKNTLQPAVQTTLTAQINETLISEGIYSSFGKHKYDFPPVSFRLTVPPHVLAISPRDRIFLQETVMLDQSMQTSQMESIESQVDAQGVSSAVLDLGGFGAAYPTFVDNSSDLQFTVETAIHEWLHQYLAFKPLGFRYVLDLLGIRPDADIATMNETVADTVSKELASILLGKYYPQVNSGQSSAQPGAFNFDQEMKNTRKTVDAYLARGDVAGAEAFMEQERQYLLTKGYYIRKLNQAYFAFNDQYADTPASTNPIGGEIESLRNQSPSLKDFLDRVSRMTSRQDLIASIGGSP